MAEGRRARGRRGNGEGSVYQRGDRSTWVAQVPVGINPDGSYRFKRYSYPTQAAAKAKLRATQEALDRGADLGAKSQTLGAFLDAWLAEVVRRDAQPKTYEGYAYTAGLIKARLGKVPLDKLTPQQVQKLINELLERGGTAGAGLSPRTEQYARAAAARARAGAEVGAGDAQRRHAGRRTPAEEAQDHAPRSRARPRAPRRRARVSSGRTLPRGAGARSAAGRDARTAVGGCRSRLRVAVALQRRKGSKTLVEPKTEQSRRTLSLPPVLVSALKAHRRRQNEERLAAGPKWRDHGLVFPSTVGTPMEPRNLVRNYKVALQRAGLPEATRFHDLRHTAASLLVAQGVHPRVVMEILGHSQIALTMNTYSHVMSESQREALAHMDHFFPETRETGD